MIKDYFPEVDHNVLCDVLKMCSVRVDKEIGKSYIAIKSLDGKVEEVLVETITGVSVYKGNPIEKVYSSGCVFVSENKEEVYLVSVKKGNIIQHQFTGGSPREEYL